MPWLPQLEEDCNQLIVDAESEDDDTLVTIVRASRICLKAAEVGRHLADNPEHSRHVALHIAPLRFTLDRFKATMSLEQAQHSKTSVTTLGFSLTPN
jgi:hypothetical protein